MIKKKVIVAMSGGVDSSVSAYILKKIGYCVEGIFMNNWEIDNNENSCNSLKDFLDTKLVTDILDIKLHTINFSKDYFNNVFKYFLNVYLKGNTPNPDILCNKIIKFNILKDFINKNIKCDYISTGHYARNIFCKKKNKNFLLRGLDKNKDQSYFLYKLNSNEINKYIFPLGNFKKNEVRKIAEKIKISNYNKKSSTGICFIGNKCFNNFLSKFISKSKGIILSEDNKFIGYHNGISFYTIGQRKGLNIGGIKGYKESPWYIIDKNIKKNILVVSQNKNHKNLISYGLIANNINWINKIPNNINRFKALVKIRYNHNNDINSLVKIFNNFVYVIFDKPNGVVVPGQSVVFYIGNNCIGGGIIYSRI
ncbi:tRNA-specific 2-thiouridylase MnmA [endosymbiont of Sipalinus gigas]|uniref:tRNA 2-thiouridine(34) synthase MnmA n=1 Tax=endosymbiont of Sipalinus gigas TaxID=1972134 RepID=UPI000DC6D5CF|nr:tRNA 2-thiouridine(34) synthase MnmA [endosymbiont of Sipalinus gigas]BBA85364.1 tRNA-specific 2-thiouridylase MnmA [endosymbiont of Sipalinus gigas]